MIAHALRRLAATPMFTLFSVVSLAAGVAVTTAVYSVVDSAFARDLGAADPDTLGFVVTPFGGRFQREQVSDPDFEDLRAAQRSFASLSASAPSYPSVATTAHAEILAAEAVDGTYFATLGVEAQAGRTIRPADDAAAARVAVLSDELWRARYAADPTAVGRTIRINGETFEVIGVAPRHYRGLFGTMRTTRLWIPRSTEALLGVAAPLSGSEPRERRRLIAVGRLAPGSTPALASAELALIGARLDREHPPRQAPGRVGPGDRAWSVRLAPEMMEESEAVRRFGLTVVGLVALVLVVACTNLANLVLARGAARQGELAVRMAMGASRGRLVWEQCVESLLLAATGLVASYLAFQWLAAMMTAEYTFGAAAMRTTLSIRPALDGTALAVAVSATLLAVAVFGLEPAVQLARTLDIRTALAKNAAGIRPRLARQRMVIRWQVTVATGFFIIATMFIRGTINLARHDPGVEMDRIAVAALDFQNGGWDEGRIRRTVDRIVAAVRTDPSVSDVAASTGLPFGIMPAMRVPIALPEDRAALRRPPLDALAVTPSAFRTLGIAIVRGRAFDDRDSAAGAPAIILCELLARQMFRGGEAVGRSLVVRQGGRDVIAEVVGVARDTDTRVVYSRRAPLVYLPLAQHFTPAITLSARATGDPARTALALREAIRRADPDVAVDAIGPGRAVLAGPFGLLGSLGKATLYLGGFTLLLSMVGLFGVQSQVVSHRTREIGVRMSVGATSSQIKAMVMKDGYRPVVEGLVLGLWGGLAGRVLVRSYMELDVNIVDWWMLVVTPIPLVLAAFCACYLPAARASRIDPTVALRAD